MTSAKRTKESKARKGTTNETRIRATLRLAMNAARWSGICETMDTLADHDPDLTRTRERSNATKLYERKTWEYLATLPGKIGQAARAELGKLDAKHVETMH